ncbi:MAG: hypothetical protein ACR2MN_15680 [Acidimicrobiales bacterium]
MSAEPSSVPPAASPPSADPPAATPRPSADPLATTPPPPTGSREPAAPHQAPDLDALAWDLGDVDVALRRLDEGTYGTCEACGTELDPRVVVAFPAARRCPAHGGPATTRPPPPAS